VQGALLTPEGWKKAGQLFTESKPYPANGTIYLWSPGIVGEDWVKGEDALVETKWDDEEGSIDSSLRYTPPESVDIIGTLFRLRLSFPLRDATTSTDTTTRTVDSPEWKLTGPLQRRVASVQQAITYVTRKRNEATDPVIRKNADKTIATLKAILHAPPSPC
jgi:hypothetical protein